jgi:peptidyl-prolyl cis-trans isomerase C
MFSLVVVAAVGCGGSSSAPQAPAPQAAAPAEPPPPEVLAAREVVIAEVNGAPVRAWQLDEVMAVQLAQFEASGFALEDDDAKRHRRAALDAIIGNELLYQAAIAEGISPSPEQIDIQIQQARSRFQTEQDYRSYLIQAGITEEQVRDQASYQLTVQSYIQHLTGELAVDEAKVREAYEKNREIFKEPAKVRGSIVVVMSDPEDPQAQRDDARRRIEEAYQRIQNGEDFAQIAREYSQGGSAAKGGDLGFFKREDDILPQVDDVAFAMEIGDISEVFETPFGFNIFMKTGLEEERQLEYDEVKPTLMLMASDQRQKDTVKERIAELRAAGNVEIIDEELAAIEAVVRTSSEG